MISALFDTSPGLFLLFKLAYQSSGVDLRLMLQLLTVASSIIWIRTLFLMPVYLSNPSRTLFEQSFFGQLIYTKQVENPLKPAENGSRISLRDELKPAIMSFNTWQFAVFYTIVSCRVKSIQGWIFPWLDWTYAKNASSDVVSRQLNVYGYTYFLSPLVGLFPGLLSLILMRFKKDEYYANLYQGKHFS